MGRTEGGHAVERGRSAEPGLADHWGAYRRPLLGSGTQGDVDYEKTTPEDVWLLQRPNGIIFVTGPTGSGKTTTLYAALRAILRQDPVWC